MDSNTLFSLFLIFICLINCNLFYIVLEILQLVVWFLIFFRCLQMFFFHCLTRFRCLGFLLFSSFSLVTFVFSLTLEPWLPSAFCLFRHLHHHHYYHHHHIPIDLVKMPYQHIQHPHKDHRHLLLRM